MTRKAVNFPQEWVAGFTRNQWQFCSGMGGRFGQESAAYRKTGLQRDWDWSGKRFVIIWPKCQHWHFSQIPTCRGVSPSPRLQKKMAGQSRRSGRWPWKIKGAGRRVKSTFDPWVICFFLSQYFFKTLYLYSYTSVFS